MAPGDSTIPHGSHGGIPSPQSSPKRTPWEDPLGNPWGSPGGSLGIYLFTGGAITIRMIIITLPQGIASGDPQSTWNLAYCSQPQEEAAKALGSVRGIHLHEGLHLQATSLQKQLKAAKIMECDIDSAVQFKVGTDGLKLDGEGAKEMLDAALKMTSTFSSTIEVVKALVKSVSRTHSMAASYNKEMHASLHDPA